jgi:hypothetical protein
MKNKEFVKKETDISKESPTTSTPASSSKSTTPAEKTKTPVAPISKAQESHAEKEPQKKVS